jgi:hypothetical protein
MTTIEKVGLAAEALAFLIFLPAIVVLPFFIG